jgi:hypothetical protein
MQIERDEKRQLKQSMRLPRVTYRSKTRYLVSVWLDEYDAWMEDMRFRFIEDAQVHAARWGRLYGATVTQISEVEV